MSEKTGRALVACPTYAGKEYALDEWVEMYDALTYEPKFAYQVDNTRISDGYFKRLIETGISCSRLNAWPDWDRTFKRCWQLILERARQLDCYWVYSVESDNVPAPESLQIMVDIALYGNLHLVTHSYPLHASAAKASGIDPESFKYHEMGCMLMSRQLLEKAMSEFDKYRNIAIAIFETCNKYEGGYCQLTNKFEVKHLDGFHMQIPNLIMSTVPGLICPTPTMPKDTGTELPPSLRGDNHKARSKR